MILFFKWLLHQGYQLNFYHNYFDREWGNNSHSGVTSKSLAALQAWELQIIPDAIAGYTTPERSHIFIFEQHMGKDVKRALKQMQQHCRALSMWSANKKYGSKRGCRIYYVFENETCMSSVIERMTGSPWFEYFKTHFRFRTMAAFTESFQYWWKSWDSQECAFSS